MTELAAIVPLSALAAGVAICLVPGPQAADRVNTAAAPVVAVAALVLAALELAPHGRWYDVDAASGVFEAVIAIVGACSAVVSPAYLRTAGRSWWTATRARRAYYAALYAFWAALLAVPIAGNLAIVWLLVEATTAASALLVSFSGRRDALEAGWKYLVLTTLGLSVALLGIVVLAAVQPQPGLHALDWGALAAAAPRLDHDPALFAYVLMIAGLATKIGWAPVHNWLPDAHSEAPAPISALLSAALLPAVLFVAWRVKAALEPALGGAAGALFIGFGMASILVAVPFLWRALPFKRLLAYSSLEHMGVIALGIGLGSPLALAGAVLHVAGHALAKSLGFYASLALARVDPQASSRASSGVAAASPPTAAAMSVSLIALAGLPPSPLFVSELLIALGAFRAGEPVVAAAALIALALGFLGLLHALLESVLGEPGTRRRAHRGERPLTALTWLMGTGLIALAVVGVFAPDWRIV